MPEFYIIITRKIFLPNFYYFLGGERGGRGHVPPAPVSYGWHFNRSCYLLAYLQLTNSASLKPYTTVEDWSWWPHLALWEMSADCYREVALAGPGQSRQLVASSTHWNIRRDRPLPAEWLLHRHRRRPWRSRRRGWLRSGPWSSHCVVASSPGHHRFVFKYYKVLLRTAFTLCSTFPGRQPRPP